MARGDGFLHYDFCFGFRSLHKHRATRQRSLPTLSPSPKGGSYHASTSQHLRFLQRCMSETNLFETSTVKAKFVSGYFPNNTLLSCPPLFLSLFINSLGLSFFSVKKMKTFQKEKQTKPLLNLFIIHFIINIISKTTEKIIMVL